MSPPLVRAVLCSSSRDILPMGDGELCGNERDMRFTHGNSPGSKLNTYVKLSSTAFAFLMSCVSNPSVNQP